MSSYSTLICTGEVFSVFAFGRCTYRTPSLLSVTPHASSLPQAMAMSAQICADRDGAATENDCR